MCWTNNYNWKSGEALVKITGLRTRLMVLAQNRFNLNIK